jgi:Spy/CpxP family protein refolding chaperone
MNKPWKLVLLLAGIFLAGGATGALLTVKLGRNWGAARPGPGQWSDGHLRRLAQRLELQPGQIDQLKPVIRRNMEEIARLRAESMTQTRAVFDRMEREISALLTPEQRIKFEESNREMRERMRKFMQKRAGAPGQGPEGGRREAPRGEGTGAPPPSGPPRDPDT